MAPPCSLAVVGAGAIGAMTAWQAARRGASVHLFDRYAAPHHRGAHAGQTRRFSVISMADPRLPPLVGRAGELWQALEHETGRSLLHRTGGLILGSRHAQGIHRALHSCATWSLPHRVLEAAQLRRRYPQHVVDDDDVAVADDATGFLRPEAAVAAAHERAMALGAVTHRESTVRAVEPCGDGVLIRHDGGVQVVDSAVVTPGAWVVDLLADLPTGAGLPGFTARQLPQTWFLPRETRQFRAAAFPVFERIGEPGGASLYGFPTVDRATVKIGVKTRRHPVVADPAVLQPHLAPDHLAEIRGVVAHRLPGLIPDPVQVSMHAEGYTDDGIPFVGPLPDCPRIVLAAGFGGAGFKYAPAVAEHIVAVVRDEAGASGVEHFGPRSAEQEKGA